ncbi:hypothetical protein [uncultured Polaribacter sp.]|uniref:hypothetical protein n=1 Tax=uncultured Polaribacter sp. TaxID=174711 RepID=UPI0030D80996|tara:strand:+ start:287 stop:1522 length:1236 start_codon:yes stop_codon:yes gene_type:complete
MKYKTFIIILLCLTNIYSQENIKSDKKTYEFTIYDGSDSFTMNQFSKNYLSSYRIFSRTIDELIPNKKVKMIVKFSAISLFGMPYTHEEGHRSVLTSKGIGSISQPFFGSNGAAYVKGVKDTELINLRNTDFPNYARLHSAGLESDYMIASKIEEFVAFEEESYEVLKEEYLLRKIGLMSYHLTTLMPSLMPEIVEEDNELKRDIVGHDIWGFVRHLHRSNMPFFRYTDFEDLTNTEKKYAKGLAWKSFSNLLSPMLFGKSSFNLNPNLKGNFSIGHSLSPFGDYFEQNFYLFYKKKYKVIFYLREFMNRDKTFLASGIKLHNYKISNKFATSVGLDLWNQPENLSFTTTNNKIGGNVYLKLNHFTFQNNDTFIKGIGFFSEIFYKTDGFLSEYASLENDFGLRFGISISY